MFANLRIIKFGHILGVVLYKRILSYLCHLDELVIILTKYAKTVVVVLEIHLLVESLVFLECLTFKMQTIKLLKV